MSFSEHQLNNEIIKSLVSKYFSFDDSSLELFNNNIDNPVKIPEFECIYNSPDLRFRIKLNEKQDMVFSANFADWFLCGTSEEWSTCLNLESFHSQSYWAGLPSLIVNKNLILVYITDRTFKTYNAITVERMLCRCWITLFKDESNSKFLFINKSYPTRMDCTHIIRNLFSEKMKVIDYLDFSKGKLETAYPIRFLWHQVGTDIKVSSNTYIDNLEIEEINEEYYKFLNSPTKKEVFSISKNTFRPINRAFKYRQGFHFLMKHNLKIGEFFEIN